MSGPEGRARKPIKEIAVAKRGPERPPQDHRDGKSW